ncbi:MAG: pyridoxamine 5'-phosphate oxidase family protein [Coriobacteriia bacterium]|nr:pyridoxamine 5'-phosphate oxidase family protein [Coriobacteriia bacterium]
MTTPHERIVQYLTQVPAWYLATCADDQPHVRPFSFAAFEDGRIWFSTSNDKDVYFELSANPKFELSAWNPGNPWIVVSGQAVFDEPSAELRQAGFEHMLGLGEAHDSANDGRLVFFYISTGYARICDITGEEESFDL